MKATVDMQRPSILERSDYQDSLIAMLLYRDPSRPSRGTDLTTDFILTSCIFGAYYAVHRTIHGIGKLDHRQKLELLIRAREMLYKQFCRTKSLSFQTQQIFDQWHLETHEMLVTVFLNIDDPIQIYAGQTQKWINMTFKYLLVLGQIVVSGGDTDYVWAYPFCHAPIDNDVLDALIKRHDLPRPRSPWSKLQYSDYMAIQRHIRARFSIWPLEVEHFLWLGQEMPDKHLVNTVSLAKSLPTASSPDPVDYPRQTPAELVSGQP